MTPTSRSVGATSPGGWEDLELARTLIARGVQIVVAKPGVKEFLFPGWRASIVDPSVLAPWRPGWAIAAVTGTLFDVIDVDPRYGGEKTLSRLEHLLPPIGGVVETPGGGLHLYVPPSGQRSRHDGGIDYQAASVAVVETTNGHYRRRVLLTLEAAHRALKRANDRGLHARDVFCELTPVGGAR
jgi:hypothetical protein